MGHCEYEKSENTLSGPVVLTAQRSLAGTVVSCQSPNQCWCYNDQGCKSLYLGNCFFQIDYEEGPRYMPSDVAQLISALDTVPKVIQANAQGHFLRAIFTPFTLFFL